MKKHVTVERFFCDICDKEASGYSNCDHCNKNFCYDCATTKAVKYDHGVYCAGSGDGMYCLGCDVQLRCQGDKKHAAYLKIAALNQEQREWYTDFNKRVELAEAELASLQDKRN